MINRELGPREEWNVLHYETYRTGTHAGTRLGKRQVAAAWVIIGNMELYETRAYRREDDFAVAIIALEQKLLPDVVRLKYELGEDWAGDPAVFFKVTIRDEVMTEKRGSSLSRHISDVINRELDPREGWDVRHYETYRTVAERERMQEPAWA